MKKLLLSGALFLTCSFAATAASQDLMLYKMPDDTAKVVDHVKPGHAITPIQTNWIKIKDLNTGKSGWIKRNELRNALQPKVYTKTIKQKDGHGTRIIEYTGTTKLSDKQIKHAMQNLEKRQAMMQQQMNRMFHESQNMLRDLWAPDPTFQAPLVDSVIIIPGNTITVEQATPTEKKPEKKKKHWWQKVN